MLLVLSLLLLMPISFAQTNSDILENYIQRFRLKGLTPPAKKKALYDLGFKLFYDKNLSGKGNISCQSCHSLGGYSADTMPLGVGEGADGVAGNRLQKDGLVLSRHTPVVYNLGYPDVRSLFWDGRVMKNHDGSWQTPEPKLNGPEPELKDVAQTLDSLLAVQAIFPLTSPEEMLGKDSKLTKIEAWNFVLKKIFEGPFKATYNKLFQAAYPGVSEFNIAHVGNAMAELQRHHFAGSNTRWDLYLKGKKEVLSERMKKGAVIFFTKAQCINCHNGEHFTNFGFQNIGTPQIGPGVNQGDDKGRFEVTQNPRDLYKFRVAPLRNIALSAPYMHSGVFKNLAEVIEHYNDPVANLRHFDWEARQPRYRDPLNLDTNSVNVDNRERLLSPGLARKLNLSEAERTDLICFLAVALTDNSLQQDLISKGVVNEISDCSPRTF